MKSATLSGIVKADGEEPGFRAGERVAISVRFPVRHYRVPQYIRGKIGVIEAVMEPPAVNNEEEARIIEHYGAVGPFRGERPAANNVGRMPPLPV